MTVRARVMMIIKAMDRARDRAKVRASPRARVRVRITASMRKPSFAKSSNHG